MSRILTQAELDSVAGMPSRMAAEKLNVGKSTINDARKAARENGGRLPYNPSAVTTGSSIETKADGSLIVESKGDVPQSKGEIDAAMKSRGFDPEEYEFTYRFSEWQVSDPSNEDGVKVLYAARAGAIPKRTGIVEKALDVTELLDAVSSWSFTPIITDEFSSVDAVLGFADPQLGKTDANGGTADTVNQIMGSFENFVEIIKQERPTEVLFADLGDGLENFNNTAAQRETNDLDLTSQIRLLRRIQAEGLRMIAPYCDRLTHASVPSNHGMVRIGPQQQAATASNDWGLEVSHQLEDVFQESMIGVTFLRPEGKEDLSLGLELVNGSRIGMSHGDQSAQAQLGTWWMKQAFGWDNPLRDADLFLYGHHHNHALEEVYEGRWAIGCASSDRGSAWYTSKTGRSSSSGMTTFLTSQRRFWQLDLV